MFRIKFYVQAMDKIGKNYFLRIIVMLNIEEIYNYNYNRMIELISSIVIKNLHSYIWKGIFVSKCSQYIFSFSLRCLLKATVKLYFTVDPCLSVYV